MAFHPLGQDLHDNVLEIVWAQAINMREPPGEGAVDDAPRLAAGGSGTTSHNLQETPDTRDSIRVPEAIQTEKDIYRESDMSSVNECVPGGPPRDD